MLNFVLGTCGVGKTKYLYDTMCALAREGSDKLLFITPDQSTFLTEKTFLELLGPKLCRNIKVLGFSRLCDYVFEQTGNRFMIFADEGVRNVVMNVAIEQVQDNLELFKKRATKADLTELMLNSIKEYKKCSITSAMLYDVADKVVDTTLSQKLSETALLYDTYDAILSKSYIDPLDSLTHIKKTLESSQLFDDYVVAVDSFYGFTAQEYDVLSVIMSQCKDMYVALTTDNADGKYGDLFFAPNRTLKRLKAIAKDNNISVAQPLVMYDNHRFTTDNLAAVNSNIFRLQKEFTTTADGSVTLFEGNSIYDEAEFVARSIKKLIIEDGYEYSDIAIVTRQSDKYIGVLDTMLDKYSISYFMDKPQDIDTKPLIKFVMSCFDVICGGFDKDDVLSLFKTGLTSATALEIADFENYLFTWDINGKMFFDEFTLNPRGFADEFTDSDTKLLAQIEHTRKMVIDALRAFYFDTKDATALDICKALMKLIYRLNCKENLQKLCDTFEAQNELDLCSEQIRLYNTFVGILDKMVNVIGDYKISAKRFCELLHINFANTDIAYIPRGVDQVDIACADRSLIDNKRAVFVIGAIEGEFPHTPVESGVFSDDERATLSAYGLNMSDGVEQLVPTEKYLAYKALCSAREKLFISYYNFTLNGEKRSVSAIIDELAMVIPDVHLSTSVDNTVFDSLWSEQSAFEYLIKRYNSSNGDVKALREHFENSADYSPTLRAVDRALCREPLRINDTALSRKLFKEQMNLSASQVECYGLCKFEYFVKYGLRVHERRAAKIDSLEYGTLMHYLFEEFFSAHKNDDFSAITEQMIEKEVSELLDKYADMHLGGVSGKTSRFVYLYYRMKRTAVRIIQRLVEEFAQSKFKPSDFELSIGDDIPSYNLKVSDDISVTIKGSVDRVDIMESDGKKYIRVVDYKTGTKKYSLSDVLYGINLQMLIYMSAINSGGDKYFGSEITPAGVLYVPAVSPVANVGAKGLSAALSESKKDCVMHGIILDDETVIKGMDSEAKGEYIPVSIKGEQIVDKGGSLATLEEFGALFRQVDKVIGEMAQSLCDGDIAAVPAKGVYDACAWCPYVSVCSYREGDNCRTVEKYKKDEVYRILNQKEGVSDEESLD